MKTDIQIAQEATMLPIKEVTAKIGLTEDVLDCDIKDIIEELYNKNIQTRPIWRLNHKQLPYKDDLNYKIDKAEWYEKRIINIPCSTSITNEEINYVSDMVKDILVKYFKG